MLSWALLLAISFLEKRKCTLKWINPVTLMQQNFALSQIMGTSKVLLRI